MCILDDVQAAAAIARAAAAPLIVDGLLFADGWFPARYGAIVGEDFDGGLGSVVGVLS